MSLICPLMTAVSAFAESESVLKKITISSTYLGKDMNINVYLPQGYSDTRKYPVLFIIHGMYADEDSWMPDLKMNKVADYLIRDGRIKPLIIVAPQMDNGYGVNSFWGLYEEYFRKELIPFIDSHYSTDPARENRFIGGLSMGGYIALYMAFSYPDMFGRVGGHSPCIFLNDTPGSTGITNWLYPSESIKRLRDPIQLAQKNDLKGIKVYLDCGDQDQYEYWKGNKIVGDILRSRGIEAEDHVFPGSHEGSYWMLNNEKYLLFYAGNVHN